MDNDVDLSNLSKSDIRKIEVLIRAQTRELEMRLEKSKELEHTTRRNFDYSMVLFGTVILFGLVLFIAVFVFMFYKKRKVTITT